MRRRGGLNFSRKRRKFNRDLFKDIMATIAEFVAVVLVAFVIVYLFGFRTSVVGSAMENTLNDGEQVFVDRLLYNISKPNIDDVIVFLPNGNSKSHYYVRRVVGVPGDTIQIIDGSLYRNGEICEEDFEVSSMEDPGIAADEITLGTDEYFVLGDNRNNSEDSRYANIGVIKKEYITGKAWFRFSGLGKMGFIR